MEFGVDNRAIPTPRPARAAEMIERVANLVGGEFLHQIEMRDLPQRMHAGIGAARAGDGDALAARA